MTPANLVEGGLTSHSDTHTRCSELEERLNYPVERLIFTACRGQTKRSSRLPCPTISAR